MPITRIVLGFCFVCVLSCLPATAQTTSNIEGTIKDPRGAVVSGAQITATSPSLTVERTTTCDENGFYRLAALPAGIYVVKVSASGFANSTFSNVELLVNRTLSLDVQLEFGNVKEQINITAEAALIDPTTPATGGTVTPRQIQDMPVNGRNYLDLMQLVPGAVVNRQANVGSDNSTPVLGERAGNNNFLIDGQPNKDTVNGGAASQFNQETIAEFQVLTTGFKAEFGQASGAVVNVITKSGENSYHGVASLFHRNEAFDSVNSLDPAVTDPLHLRRFDYSLALGGPIIKKKIFFFGSSERITEDRVIDFKYPDLGPSAGAATVLQLLRNQENPFDIPQRNRAIRNFFKLDEQFGRHHLDQEVNYTNEYARGGVVGLPTGGGLPTTRTSTSARNLLLGFGDTM